MSTHHIAQKIPAYAARLLVPGEGVLYLTRPRILPLNILVFMVVVVLAMVAFSLIIDDLGFLRLLSIPALPVLGGSAGYFLISPVILVTKRRVVSAQRFFKPLFLDLEKLEKIHTKQTRLERFLGYGTLQLLFPHPRDHSEGVFLCYSLEKLPHAASLASAISMAARALRIDAAIEN